VTSLEHVSPPALLVCAADGKHRRLLCAFLLSPCEPWLGAFPGAGHILLGACAVGALGERAETSALRLLVEPCWSWCSTDHVKAVRFQSIASDENDDLLLLVRGNKPDTTRPASEQRRKTGSFPC